MAERKAKREQGIYRRVTVRMWGDAKVMALTRPQPCGQVLWLHLLTGEQTDIIPGLCKIGEAAFAEQLGWPLEGFRKAFAEVSRLGMVKADWDARVVWVPKAIEHNAPVSPNVVKSWADAWDRIPECALKLEAWDILGGFLQGMTQGFREAFAESCPKPSVMPSRIQEQDQEQDQEEAAAAGRARRAGKRRRSGPEAAKEAATTTSVEANPGPVAAHAQAERQEDTDAAGPVTPATLEPPAAPERSPLGSREAAGAVIQDEIPSRPLVVFDLVEGLGPKGEEFKARLEVELHRGLSGPAKERREEVGMELEQLLALHGVDRAVSWVAATCHGREGGGAPCVASVTGCLLILRSMPKERDPLAAARARCPEWAKILEAVAPSMQPGTLEAWLATLEPTFLRGELVLEAPNACHQHLVEDMYLQGLRRAAVDVVAPHVVVNVKLAAGAAAEA
jgi:hypothetical protein